MLKTKFVVALLFSILILTLVAENEVDAAPEPCGEFFSIPAFEKHKKPKDDEREKEKKRKKEKYILIEKFLEGLFGFK